MPSSGWPSPLTVFSSLVNSLIFPSAPAKRLHKRNGTLLDCREHMRGLLAQLSRTGQQPLQCLQLLADHFCWPSYIADLGELQQPLSRGKEGLVAYDIQRQYILRDISRGVDDVVGRCQAQFAAVLAAGFQHLPIGLYRCTGEPCCRSQASVSIATHCAINRRVSAAAAQVSAKANWRWRSGIRWTWRSALRLSVGRHLSGTSEGTTGRYRFHRQRGYFEVPKPS